jgi:F0F1-type ATP synthase membrane subunit c/vacuolar-type H+-ATPase subunit K
MLVSAVKKVIEKILNSETIATVNSNINKRGKTQNYLLVVFVERIGFLFLVIVLYVLIPMVLSTVS